jgi:hypothetical protein
VRGWALRRLKWDLRNWLGFAELQVEWPLYTYTTNLQKSEDIERGTKMPRAELNGTQIAYELLGTAGQTGKRHFSDWPLLAPAILEFTTRWNTHSPSGDRTAEI